MSGTPYPSFGAAAGAAMAGNAERAARGSYRPHEVHEAALRQAAIPTRDCCGSPVNCEHHGDCTAPRRGHAGWPVSVPEVLERTMSGLPVYWPTDPKLIDQAPYLRFAAERGPNTQ